MSRLRKINKDFYRVKGDHSKGKSELLTEIVMLRPD